MKTLSKEDLKKMNEKEHEDFVLINVLPKDHFNRQHIRTSVNVPHDRDDFTDQVESISGHKGRKIVVYCASFDCDASPNAAKKLEKAGFTNVYDYEGGTEDWFEHRKSA